MARRYPGPDTLPWLRGGHQGGFVSNIKKYRVLGIRSNHDHHSFLPFPSECQGDYVDAEALYERSLTIREKALGPDHPDVGQSLNNWAMLLHKQVKT